MAERKCRACGAPVKGHQGPYGVGKCQNAPFNENDPKVRQEDGEEEKQENVDRTEGELGEEQSAGEEEGVDDTKPSETATQKGRTAEPSQVTESEDEEVEARDQLPKKKNMKNAKLRLSSSTDGAQDSSIGEDEPKKSTKTRSKRDKYTKTNNRKSPEKETEEKNAASVSESAEESPVQKVEAKNQRRKASSREGSDDESEDSKKEVHGARTLEINNNKQKELLETELNDMPELNVIPADIEFNDALDVQNTEQEREKGEGEINDSYQYPISDLVEGRKTERLYSKSDTDFDVKTFLASKRFKLCRCNYFSDDEEDDLEPCHCEGEIVFDDKLAGKVLNVFLDPLGTGADYEPEFKLLKTGWNNKRPNEVTLKMHKIEDAQVKSVTGQICISGERSVEIQKGRRYLSVYFLGVLNLSITGSALMKAKYKGHKNVIKYKEICFDLILNEGKGEFRRMGGEEEDGEDEEDEEEEEDSVAEEEASKEEKETTEKDEDETEEEEDQEEDEEKDCTKESLNASSSESGDED